MPKITTSDLKSHQVVSKEEWLEARKALLAEEKAIMRQTDALHEKRRQLPWVKVEKDYLFDGPKGKQSLADLFDGRSQLIVYHFMFAPGDEEGCTGCSFVGDHIDGANLHLPHIDVSLVSVSRAPWPEFEAFKKRMDWKFHWVSSAGSSFNYDYHIAFTAEQIATGSVNYNYSSSPLAFEDLHGLSVFYKDEDGNIFHTYSTYARGVDLLLGAYNYMDLTPKGRQEEGTMDHILRHDRYEAGDKPSCCH